jgi:hypothetical protein
MIKLADERHPMATQAKPALMRAKAKALIRTIVPATQESRGTQEEVLALLDQADAIELSSRPYTAPLMRYAPEDWRVPQVTCGNEPGVEYL